MRSNVKLPLRNSSVINMYLSSFNILLSKFICFPLSQLTIHSTHKFCRFFSQKMAAFFNLIRPGYELVTVKLEWNVQVPFLQPDGNGQHSLTSPLFSSQETPNRKWQLQIDDSSGTQIKISLFQYNSWKSLINFVEPVLVRMSIIDIYGQKCLLQILPSERPTWNYHSYTTTTNTTFTFPPSVEFLLSKQEIWQSDCQQSDESLTFNCKIFTHVKKETAAPPDRTWQSFRRLI